MMTTVESFCYILFSTSMPKKLNNSPKVIQLMPFPASMPSNLASSVKNLKFQN